MALNLMSLLGGMGGGGLPARPVGGGGVTPALMQAIASLTGPQINQAPPPMAQGGSPIDAQIEEQIRALSEPEPVVPIDVPNAPGTLQKILAAIADSAGIYAGGLNPMVGPIGASGMLADQARARQEAIRANAMNKSSADFRGRQAGAELKLRQLLGQKGAETEAAKEKKEGVKLQEQRTYDEGQDLIKHERQLAEIAAREAAETERAKIREAGDTARSNIANRRNRGDKTAQEQLKAISEAKAEINSMADNFKQLIAAGVSPSQMRTTLRRRIATLNPDPDAQAVIDAYMDAELENDLQLEEYNLNTAASDAEFRGAAADLEKRAKVAREKPITPVRSFGSTSRSR